MKRPTFAAALETARSATTPEAQLAALLAVWRIQPLVEVATAIETLGKRIHAGRKRLPGKTMDARHGAWFECAARRDPAEIDLLLTDPVILAEHSFGSQWGGTLERKLVELAAMPADPRVSRALIALVRDIPRTSFAPQALRIIAAIGDPRALVPVQGMLTRKSIREAAVATATVAKLARVKVGKADAATKKVLAGIGSAGKQKRQSLKALFAAVCAAPKDDGPRLVYADALQLAGDPLGEYIVLAVNHERGKLDGTGRARMRALLAANKAKWMEPLDRALTSAGPKEFKRGFLSRCRITGVSMVGEPRIRAIYEHPAWALVEEVLITDDGVAFRAPLVKHLRKLGVTITVT